MSIKPVTFEDNSEGQPNTDSAMQEVDSQPTPLTEQRVVEIVKKSTAESMSEFYRLQKQQMDKQESRIKKEVQTQIESLKKLGVDVTEDMEKNLENMKRQEIVTESQQGDSNQDAGQPNDQDQTPTNPIIEDAMRDVGELEKSYGFELDPSDPEASMIVHTSAYKFVNSYEKALKAKQERLEAEGSAGRNPLAQTPIGGGTGTPGNPLRNMDIDSVWDQAKKTIRR